MWKIIWSWVFIQWWWQLFMVREGFISIIAIPWCSVFVEVFRNALSAIEHIRAIKQNIWCSQIAFFVYIFPLYAHNPIRSYTWVSYFYILQRWPVMCFVIDFASVYDFSIGRWNCSDSECGTFSSSLQYCISDAITLYNANQTSPEKLKLHDTGM